MGFVVVMIRDTALLSIVVSTVFAVVLCRVSWAKSCSGAVALVVGFFAAWTSQTWTTLTPERYLDWFPYVTIALGVVGTLISIDDTKRWPWFAATLCCILAAWFLVPSFRSLQPRRLYAIGISTFTLVLAFATEELVRRIRTRLFTACLAASGIVGAIVLAQSFGLKFAQIAGMITAGLTGFFVATFIAKDLKPNGLPLVFCVMMTHLMFIGWASSSSKVPATSYVLPLLAPLGLWLTLIKQPTARRELAIGLVVVALLLLLALIPAILAHPPWEGELG